MKVFIIAEAGVNHNGDIRIAKKLCDAAKKAGVDAVKFQTWITDNLVAKNAPLALYQEQNITNKQDSQFEMLKKLELQFDEFLELKEYCKNIDLKFLSTPDDADSLDFLSKLELDFLKVGSGEVNNIPFLRRIGAKKQHVILSTGMSYLRDVELAYYTLIESGALSVKLLHCTSNYPCPMEEVNLNAMITLKTAFKCEVGYSDHTLGIEVPIAAVALGATIIEKHFTLDKEMDGPDHKASLNPVELEEMVLAIRNIEVALGTGHKIPNKSELETSKVVWKSIVASKTINLGDVFSESNLTLKRTGSGISAKYWDMVIGKKANQVFVKDDLIVLN